MSKAAAKRELFAIIERHKPWDVISDEDQARIEELKAIVYPNGMTLPLI